MITTKAPSKYSKEEYIHPPKGGHAACPGCGVILALRYFLKAMGEKVVFVVAAGCAIIITGSPQPSLSYQGKRIPRAVSVFGNSASVAAGLKTALTIRGDTETEVVAWSGDGATFDIGLGTVSAAAERNEDIIYVCYDNEAYMNTGNQKSSATPWGAITTTNPLPTWKTQPKKDIMFIMMAHNIPYAATTTIAYPDDLMRKVEKAKSISGFRFLHILTPCPTAWGYPAGLTVKLSRLAVETNVFPLFEVENGSVLTLNKESQGIPVQEYIKIQRRYKHLSSEQIDELQESVEERWSKLQWLAGYKGRGCGKLRTLK